MSHEALGRQFHPHLEDMRSGGIGHLPDDESRSVVGFVPPHALLPYAEHDGIQNPHIEGHDRKIIDSIRADIRSGVGIRSPLMMEYDHERRIGSLGEGNHRLRAAIEENTPVVPVTVYGRSRLAARKENGLTAPLRPATTWTGGVGEDYIPPNIHPLHFEQFKDAQ